MFKQFIILSFLFFNTIIGDQESLSNQGFSGDTLVRTAAGYKAIEHIKTGEFVFCAGKNGSSQQPVKAVHNVLAETVIAVETSNSATLCGTHQKFYLPREDRWETAQNLSPGMMLLDKNNNLIPITNVTRINEATQLYDLTIKECHNFHVSLDAVLVHNVDPGTVYVILDGIAKTTGTIFTWAAETGLIQASIAGGMVYREKTRGNGQSTSTDQQTKAIEDNVKYDPHVYAIQNEDGTFSAPTHLNSKSSRPKTVVNIVDPQTMHPDAIRSVKRDNPTPQPKQHEKEQQKKKASKKPIESEDTKKNKANDAQAPGKPTKEDGFVPAKKWDGKKVKHPKTSQYGYPDKKGNIWVPTGPGPLAHGGPHWDVVSEDGKKHKNIVPGGRIRGEK